MSWLEKMDSPSPTMRRTQSIRRRFWLLDPIVPNASRVTDLNPKLRKREMGSVRIIDWLDDDGERLRGALLLPVGYEAGRRYP